MKLLFICDPISELNPQKDTSIFLIEKAWERNYECFACESSDFTVKNHGNDVSLSVESAHLEKPENKNQSAWFRATRKNFPINYFDFVFIRKDPPFDVD